MPNNWVGKEVTYAETWNRTIGAWPVGQGISRSKGTSQPPASPVSTHPKQGNPSKIHAHRVATRSAASRCRLAPSNPLKAKVDGWSRELWQAAGIGWANVTALSSTVRHQPFQRHVTAHSAPVSTHPKQGNPSKIHADRVATRSAEPLPFGTFEPPKSKGGRLKQEALASGRHWLGGRNGLEQHRAASAIPKARHSPQRHRWARIRNRETPARFGPNGLPLGRQSRCRLAPSNPLKAKVDGWSRELWQAAGIGWANVTALSSTVRHQPFHH